MSAIEPFDRRLRRARRNRAHRQWAEHAFLQEHISAELFERLGDVQRNFKTALLLGFPGFAVIEKLRHRGIETILADAGSGFAEENGGVHCDEDRLPFRDASFDLVLSTGTLDTVNDLPGALTLIRRCLKPDGLFLAGFVGAGSLPRLREAMQAADALSGIAAPRIHPQIDVRAAGDLLGRAGFALQVADTERLTVRYRELAALVADLRGSANSSLMQAPPLSKAAAKCAHDVFPSKQVSDRTAEIFELIYLTGWAPAPGQPKPARRGSGNVSLADTLGKTP